MIEQLSIFDASEEFKITNKVRLIELFAGIGSQAMALRNIGADFETYRVVEFDKYAIASYNAIHGTNFPTMDVTKIHGYDLGICERDKYTYIMTYSFPCTDLSNAGKMLGMAEGSGTRSSLLWEVKRLLDECKSLPQVLLMENVPQVHSKQNIEHFNRWLNYLESLGYKNYWKDMNAKNYGVAQSRNRTFVVSILGNYNYDFPTEIPLTKKMKDYLDDVVDERFYLTSDKARDLIDKLVRDNQIKEKKETIEMYGMSSVKLKPTYKSNDISATLLARDYKFISNFGCNGVVEVIGSMDNSIDNTYESANRVYSKESVSPTISTMQGGGTEPKVMDVIAYDEQNRNTRYDTFGTLTIDGSSPKHNNRVIEYGHMDMWKGKHQSNTVYDSDGLAPCCTTKTGGGHETKIVDVKSIEYGTTHWSHGRCESKADFDGIAQTIDAGISMQHTMLEEKEKVQNRIERWTWEIDGKKYYIRIRKLTPKECWRLMGFIDDDFFKAEKVNSNTQLYKQAGNSIVVNCLEEIFKNLF